MDAIQPLDKATKPRILMLVDFHHPLLRQPAETVHFPLSELDKQLIRDMKYSIQPEQLKAANAPWDSAGGMAANQWGANKRIFLFCPDNDTDVKVIINPSYEPLTSATTHSPAEDLCWEGCFSVPLATGNVKRYTDIRVQYQDEEGKTIVRELSGRHARVFQHETDHLNGFLYYELGPEKCIDKRTFASREAVDEFYDAVYETRKKAQEKLISCPCGSGADFKACCSPYLHVEKYAPTPEALMRSRYTAYFNGNLTYIEATMREPALIKFHQQKNTKRTHEWLGLQVIAAYDDLDPNVGYVEFIAKYKHNNRADQIHERSKFHRKEGRWYYVDGEFLT
ncbi:MAG TPA: YchJ family metal-binding protein [Gammaproteobacteria bacterium]|nr:YchJ family metal-binding protein [Gammaproteobacteria bacterium]